MKKIIFNGTIFFALLAVQTIQAQGTITYLSNLGQPSASADAVGSDSWLATAFVTGNNAVGYSLNSIQLAMTDLSGNPTNFTVMLYSAIQAGDFSPGGNLGTLNGSLNPATGGIYIYTPISSLTLSSSTAYFIVLTAGTAISNGAYNWSNTGTFPITYNPSDGWQAPVGLTHGDNYESSNGSSWNVLGAFPQYAITATAVPEPSALGLLVLCGLLFLRQRRKAKVIC
jgi:hypothetical protein